jgi:hypothetical protein
VRCNILNVLYLESDGVGSLSEANETLIAGGAGNSKRSSTENIWSNSANLIVYECNHVVAVPHTSASRTRVSTNGVVDQVEFTSAEITLEITKKKFQQSRNVSFFRAFFFHLKWILLPTHSENLERFFVDGNVSRKGSRRWKSNVIWILEPLKKI